MSRVGVIGAGGWGTVLAKLLTANGHQVVLWSYEAETAEEINRDHTNNRFLRGSPFPKHCWQRMIWNRQYKGKR